MQNATSTRVAAPRPRVAGWARAALVAACATLVTACSGAGASRGAVSLEALRRRATGFAPDGLARRDRALAELVAPGGDAALAARELAALRASQGGDPRVRFGLALVELTRGDFEHGAEDLAAVIETARTRRDPLGGALAEVAVGKLIAVRGDVRDFARLFRPVVEAVARDPGYLGPSAALEVLETATRWARETGSRDDETRWIHASGCVTQWTVVGAFGPHTMLRFDETLPPEATGPLASTYDLGPGRGVRRNWQIQARGCAANLGRGYTDAGVFFAATDVVSDRDRDVVLHVESPNVFAVLVDGVRVATLDGRRRPTGTSVAVPLRLAAGRHTLRVKLASRYFSPLLVAAVTDPAGRGVVTYEPASAGAHERPPAPAEDPLDLMALATAPDQPPFERYVAAEFAFARRNPIAAREALRPLAVDERATPVTLIAWSSVAVADPFTPSVAARDTARRALESVRRRAPDAYYAYLALARLAGDDDRADEALALVRAAHERFADNPEVQSELIERLMERNWDGEAQTVLTQAQRQLPDACWPVRLQMAMSQRHASGDTETELAARIRRCDALSEAGALAAVRARRWGDAAREYQRLLETDPEGRAFRRAIADVARQHGALSDATAQTLGVLDENPTDAGLRADLVDLHLAQGHASEARALLDRELARAPADMAELFRFRSALSGREELGPWRLDGREILRAFSASGHRYDSGAVLVLDYTVRRVLGDGSSLELTHNVVRLQSQEAIDAQSQFNPPQGAVILTLRTHKADGRVLEPETIARLDAIAFPDVHIGDAIEFEYVRAIPPSDATPRGFGIERFYFRGFDEPYDRSELVLVVPRAFADGVHVDPRGPAPPTQRRELGGALVEYRWGVRQSHRMIREPRAVAFREFVPSVSVGVDGTWDNFVDLLRDRLSDLDPYDPAAERLARQIVGDARRPSERLVRLHHWVAENVTQEGGGTPFASAPAMVAGRTGHRGRVLCYLLGLQNIPCRMALVRQGGSDTTESPLADAETYGAMLLLARTERGDTWINAAERSTPASYIPPTLAGQPALVVDRGAPRLRAPAFDPAAHTRDVTLAVVLAPDGTGRVEAVERMHGSWAVSWREALRGIDPANVRQEFEGYLGRQVTAASLQTYAIEGQTDPEADLVLRYTFTAPNLATRTAEGLVFEGMYHAELGPSYAQVPQRTTTMFNGEALHVTQEIDVVMPPGGRIAELPADVGGEAPGITWAMHAERTARGFHTRRTVAVPPGRITAEVYPRFAAQVRAIDDADARRVLIRVP